MEGYTGMILGVLLVAAAISIPLIFYVYADKIVEMFFSHKK